MMEEHPIKQAIRGVTVWNGTEGVVEYGAYPPEAYFVGHDDVTRIEPFQKSGMHANIAYVRVWKGDEVHAEFCQHGIVGIYFETTPDLNTCGHPKNSAECSQCLPF